MFECAVAGVVVAVGAGVRHLQPGMAAFGLAEGSLGSHVTAVAETLVTTVQHFFCCNNFSRKTCFVCSSCWLKPWSAQSIISFAATTSPERRALFALLVG